MRILQKAVNGLDVLLREFGIELRQSTLRTQERLKRCLMPDAKSVKHTTVSLGFNVEVTDSFCGYVRLLQLDITIRTVAFTHWTYIRLVSQLIKKSGNGFILGNTTVKTFHC